MSVTRMVVDMAVRSRDGRLAVIVEVKNPTGMTAVDAIQYRRNLVEHGYLSPNVPFFMVASQDTGFVWPGADPADPDAAPELRFSMRPVIDRHASWLPPGDRLGKHPLRLILLSWFWDLALFGRSAIEEPELALNGIGLLDAIRGGSVELDSEL